MRWAQQHSNLARPPFEIFCPRLLPFRAADEKRPTHHVNLFGDGSLHQEGKTGAGARALFNQLGQRRGAWIGVKIMSTIQYLIFFFMITAQILDFTQKYHKKLDHLKNKKK